ncbi:MAG: alpha/beta fold hydrolase [Burkholderiales bacterium]|nr:alpha/beta fold hydrolase [Burkholderiales bacterium]
MVVVACGGGIPARFYAPMARHLAQKGLATLTFDYRGVGESIGDGVQRVYAGVESWAQLDFSAALNAARHAYPAAPVAVVAHSFGALLIGAARDANAISRIVLLGPHTGYWRDYATRWRWLLYLTWHVMMPVVTRLVGYFPGRALHLGGDLPRAFALDWAGRRAPAVARTADQRRRFEHILARYGQTRADALVLSITDDAFAPPAAARRLLSLYPNLKVTQASVRPSDLRRKRLGHMAFVRRSTGPYFWERVSAWLLLSSCCNATLSTPGATSTKRVPGAASGSGTDRQVPTDSANLFQPSTPSDL